MAAYYQNIDLKTNCDLFAKSLMIDRFDTIKISELGSVHNGYLLNNGELFYSDYLLVFRRDKRSFIAINYK